MRNVTLNDRLRGHVLATGVAYDQELKGPDSIAWKLLVFPALESNTPVWV